MDLREDGKNRVSKQTGSENEFRNVKEGKKLLDFMQRRKGNWNRLLLRKNELLSIVFEETLEGEKNRECVKLKFLEV